MEKNKYIQYQLLSEMLKYPSVRFPEEVGRCSALLKKEYPEAFHEFERFENWVKHTPMVEMEEVYTKTFHIQAICYLDLGYVLFGEDYKRGEFLVNMKKEQRDAGNDCGDELPDNLVNVLTLIPKLDDDEFLNELVVKIIIPALHKMLDEFKSARMELKTKILRKKHKAILLEDQANGNIYQYVLRALVEVFSKDFEKAAQDQPLPAFSPAINGFGAAACGGCSFINSNTLKTTKP